jgi:hypothetical protein
MRQARQPINLCRCAPANGLYSIKVSKLQARRIAFVHRTNGGLLRLYWPLYADEGIAVRQTADWFCGAGLPS